MTCNKEEQPMGNLDVIFMVISVVLVVLGLAYVGLYYLNKSVDQTAASADR
jgi:hypothetical protein